MNVAHGTSAFVGMPSWPSACPPPVGTPAVARRSSVRDFSKAATFIHIGSGAGSTATASGVRLRSSRTTIAWAHSRRAPAQAFHPSRICVNASCASGSARLTQTTTSYVNYARLHGQTIALPSQTIPLPKGKQAHFRRAFYNGHSPIPDPLLGTSQSPFGAGRVGVVDLGEVGPDR